MATDECNQDATRPTRQPRGGLRYGSARRVLKVRQIDAHLFNT